MLGNLLAQFLLRLGWGLASAMAMTSSAHVTSGFFRVHLWVLMGLDTLAALGLLATGGTSTVTTCLVATVVGAVISYVGAVCWLYEQPRLGKPCLILVALANLAAGIAWLEQRHPGGIASAPWAWATVDFMTSGVLLGVAITSMFLGHWYLNTPTMQLAPLERLIRGIGVALVTRTGFLLVSLVAAWTSGGPISSGTLLLIVLRWLAGLIAAGVVTRMAWQTLKIPNTQSATGLLYVVVIVVFLGEMTSQLLSAVSPFPL